MGVREGGEAVEIAWSLLGSYCSASQARAEINAPGIVKLAEVESRRAVKTLENEPASR